MTSTRCKLFIYAAAAALASCVGYLAGAWFMVYALRPEHPEIAPRRLFDGAVSHLPAVVLSFAAFQLVALALVPRRVSGIRLDDLVATAAEVSGLFALIHGLLIDFTAFDSIGWLIAGSAPVMILITVALIHLRKGESSIQGTAAART